MSSRALKRLQAQQDAKALEKLSGEVHSEESLNSDDESVTVSNSRQNRHSRKKKTKPAVNTFALLGGNEDVEDAEVHSSDENGDVNTYFLEHQSKNVAHEEDIAEMGRQGNQGARKKKKGKKKKGKENRLEDVQIKEDDDEIERSIREVNDMFGECLRENYDGANSGELKLDVSRLLGVELRNLNPENELRRKFGNVARSERRRNDHRRQMQRSHWLVAPRPSWSPLTRAGISMRCLEKRGSISYFVFEHSSHYQKIQFQFLDAVESLDHNNIVALLNAHQYHVDSLMQLSEICKISEDYQMAAELIEKALYVLESGFHLLFNLTHGNCRLEYRRKENRAFFIALFRHVHYVANRACYVTALEFCKLILSLSPEDDPLGITLMIDYYALKAEKYDFLIKFYNEKLLEDNPIVGLLPNFAFSIAMAIFFSSNGDTSEANNKLCKALVTFPSILLPLMDKCGVTLDTEICEHPFFARTKELLEPVGIKALSQLFISRNFSIWKQSEVLDWVTTNCKEVIQRLQSDPTIGVQEEKSRREQEFYKAVHRPIDRHIIMTEFKEALAHLPPHIKSQSLMTLDPLPPANSVDAYTRPARASGNREERGLLSLFLRSLLPSYNMEGNEQNNEPSHIAPANYAHREGVAEAPNLAVQMQDGARGLVGALRQLLDTMTYRGDLNEPAQDLDQDGQEWDDEEAQPF